MPPWQRKEFLMIATLPARETRTTEDLVAPVAGEIRMMAPQAEASRRLPVELVACLKQAGLLSIYMPKEFGGLELPLPDALRVVEEVARHDGSTGGPSRWAWQTACSPRASQSLRRSRVGRWRGSDRRCACFWRARTALGRWLSAYRALGL